MDPCAALSAWARVGRQEEGVHRFRNALASHGVRQGPEHEAFVAAVWRKGLGLGDPWLQFPDLVHHQALAPDGSRLALGTGGGLVLVLGAPHLAEELRLATGGRLSWLGFRAGRLLAAAAAEDGESFDLWTWVPGDLDPARSSIPTPGLPGPRLVAVSTDAGRGLVRSLAELAVVDLDPPGKRAAVRIDRAGLELPRDARNDGIDSAWLAPDGSRVLLHWVSGWSGAERASDRRWSWDDLSLHDVTTGRGRRLGVSSKYPPGLHWRLDEDVLLLTTTEDRDPQTWAESESGLAPDPITRRVGLRTGTLEELPARDTGVDGAGIAGAGKPPAAPVPRIECPSGILTVTAGDRFPHGTGSRIHAHAIVGAWGADSGRLLVTRDDGGRTVVWDATSGLPRARLDLDRADELLVASGSSKAIFGSRHSEEWMLVDLEHPEPATPLPKLRGWDEGPGASAISPDGSRQIVASPGGRVVVRALQGSFAQEEWESAARTRGSRVVALGFGPDGTWIWVLSGPVPALAVGAADPGSKRRVLVLHDEQATDQVTVRALPGRPRVLILGRERLSLADFRTRRVSRLSAADPPPRGPLAVSQDGRRICLIGRGEQLLRFDLDPDRPVLAPMGPPVPIAGRPGALLFAPSGPRLLAAYCGHLRVLDLAPDP